MKNHIFPIIIDGKPVITAAQIRAARALLGIDQRALAQLSGLSVPTVQRTETSEAAISGNVDSLMKLAAALDLAGVERIGEGAASPSGGRGVRLESEFANGRMYYGEKPVDEAARGIKARARCRSSSS